MIEFIAVSGGRLDQVLKSFFESDKETAHISRTQAAQLIAEGVVSIDGHIVTKPAEKIKAGQGIRIVSLVAKGQEVKDIIPQSIPFSILYEDESIIVINKGANLVVHPGAGNRDGTMLNGLAYHFSRLNISPPERFGLVHRLDKDTTGVILIAKTSPALLDLQSQFANRKVKKEYLALVFVPPRGAHIFREADGGTIEGSIRRHSTNRLKMTVSEVGKPSTTTWKVIHRYQYGALLSVGIKTGRTHQIRVHMESVRSAVIGDTLYGTEIQLPKQLSRYAQDFGRQALHAHTLIITHPVTKAVVSFTAPIPEDMERLIKFFEVNTQ